MLWLSRVSLTIFQPFLKEFYIKSERYQRGAPFPYWLSMPKAKFSVLRYLTACQVTMLSQTKFNLSNSTWKQFIVMQFLPQTITFYLKAVW